MGIFGSKEAVLCAKEITPCVFSLKNNKTTFDTEESCLTICSSIEKHNPITVVCLSGNTFGIDASKAVSEALKSHGYIEAMDLSDIFTGRLRNEIPRSIDHFSSLLETLKHLKEVDLSDNAFGPDCASHLGGFLSTAYSLVTLKIRNCGLGPVGGTMIADSLIKLGKDSKEKNLRKLVIGRNRLEDGSCSSFKEVFALHNLIKEVSIAQNGIRPDGIVLLLEGLEECKNLTKLDIQDNTFSEAGADAFDKALCSWKEISYLDISDCLVPKKQTKNIVGSLSKNKASLCYLGLQYCEIDDEIGLQVSELISSMNRLNTLKLNGNYFSCNGKTAEKIHQCFDQFCDKTTGLGIDEWNDMEDASSSVDSLAEDIDGFHVGR